MKHIGLFEGIGGFSLAARWMGWETVAYSEWNEFCQKVLKYYFPEAEGYGDITKTDFTKYANTIDIVTGGFPCQPYSTAGKRKGTEDNRHLWPEMLRAIREIKPRFVVGENVSGLISWNGGMVFEQVQIDLENEGYEVQPILLPACAVNAPHRRDRIWFVAYTNSFGNNSVQRTKGGPDERKQPENKIETRNGWTSETERYGTSGIITNSNEPPTEHPISTRWNLPTSIDSENTFTDTSSSRWIQNNQELSSRQSKQDISSFRNFPTQSPICNGDDGLSSRLDAITFPKWRSESIKAGGNAIVPQVAMEIFKVIEQLNSL